MAGLFFDDYDTPVFRPPSEADSFILRVTRVSVKFSSVIHLTVDNYYLRGFGLISISV